MSSKLLRNVFLASLLFMAILVVMDRTLVKNNEEADHWRQQEILRAERGDFLVMQDGTAFLVYAVNGGKNEVLCRTEYDNSPMPIRLGDPRLKEFSMLARPGQVLWTASAKKFLGVLK